MKKLVCIIFLALNACIRGTDLTYRITYQLRNNFALDASIFYFRGGVITDSINLSSQETKWFSEGGGRGTPKNGSVSNNVKLLQSDSVKIKFADGKVKTDYINDYVSPNSKSIYRDEYYITEQNCANYCSEYNYVIDEQDYAEAK